MSPPRPLSLLSSSSLPLHPSLLLRRLFPPWITTTSHYHLHFHVLAPHLSLTRFTYISFTYILAPASPASFPRGQSLALSSDRDMPHSGLTAGLDARSPDLRPRPGTQPPPSLTPTLAYKPPKAQRRKREFWHNHQWTPGQKGPPHPRQKADHSIPSGECRSGWEQSRKVG